MAKNNIPASGYYENYKSVSTSFSGADIVTTITPIGGSPIVFGELQTVSYSIYRPTTPVYALGRIDPKGMVRGQRTIAGSLIFTVFDRHVLQEVMNAYVNPVNSNGTYSMTQDEINEMKQDMLSDELPPFDININFLNEYGNSATLTLYSCHIITEGQTMSIEDMITENTMQYIAMHIDLMKNTGLSK
jgi:hypothetical protein